MLRQFNRLLALALLIAITLYITLTNSDTATIKIGPSVTVTTYAGVIYLGVFFFGCLVASIVALFFGFKSFLRERRLRASVRARESFFELFVKARGFMASEEWNAARAIWEQVLNQEPDNVIARVELSTCLENMGDLREALKVLDETRASSRGTPEVLFKAVSLNRKMGNKTAAMDNLALLVAEAPTKRALELSRNIAEELGRIDDALDYHRGLEKIGHVSDEMVAVKTRLSFEQLVRSVENQSALRETLTVFVRKHPSFTPGLEKLAQIEITQGRLDEGAELLVKAAKLSGGDPTKWIPVIDLWLKTAPGDFQRRSERAIAAARSATQGAHGAKRIDAELLLAKTLLATNRPEESQATLDGIDALAEKESVRLSPQQIQTRTHLVGLSLSRLGLAKDTNKLWEALVEPTLAAANSGKKPALSDRGEPSPVLSTP